MQIHKTFDHAAERSVEETLLSNNTESRNLKFFNRKLKITTFTKRYKNKEINEFHLRLSIECSDLHIKQLLYEGALLHKNKASPYIQTYYDVLKHQTNKFKFCIEAELYRFTLADLLFILQQKNLKMPKQSTKYFVRIILEIYLYLKDLKLPQKVFSYQICPENLAFNEDFRLMLINPCTSNLNKYSHNYSGYQGIINDIYYTIEELSHYIKQFQDQLSFLKRVKKRLNQQGIEKGSTFFQDLRNDFENNTNIPPQLFHFMESYIFPTPKVTQNPIYITIKTKQDKKKKDFYKLMESLIVNPNKEP